jgi:hypothetical protein
MSLKRKLDEIEREDREEESIAGSLVTPWVLGGILVASCMLAETCEKDKHWDYEPVHQKVESIYQENDLFAYSAKNIKYFDYKF